MSSCYADSNAVTTDVSDYSARPKRGQLKHDLVVWERRLNQKDGKLKERSVQLVTREDELKARAKRIQIRENAVREREKQVKEDQRSFKKMRDQAKNMPIETSRLFANTDLKKPEGNESWLTILTITINDTIHCFPYRLTFNMLTHRPGVFIVK